MARPRTDNRAYWSEDHRYALAFCAGKAQYVLRRSGIVVDTAELMQEGWWRCMRRVEVTELKLAWKHTIYSMIEYGRAKYPLRLSDEQVWLYRLDRNVEYPVDDFDSVSWVLDQVSPELAVVAWLAIGLGVPRHKIAKALGITGERVRQRRNEFLALATIAVKVQGNKPQE